jgi:hypothetical protein
LKDIFGIEAAIVVDNPIQKEGEFTTSFDVSVLPSGVYYLTLKTGSGILTRQFVVVK